MSGEFLKVNQIDCHHKIPKCYGGNDSYENLIIVSDKIHILVHSTNERTIQKYLGMLNLNKKQMNKLNKLREMAQMPALQYEV